MYYFCYALHEQKGLRYRIGSKYAAVATNSQQLLRFRSWASGPGFDTNIIICRDQVAEKYDFGHEAVWNNQALQG